MQEDAFGITREALLPHLSHPSGLSQLFPRAQRARLRTAPAFLHEGQGKKLTFSAIRYSPYSPASHSVFAAIQVCSAQLFSLKYPTLQRGKKSLSAAAAQAKNNPFLVIKMRVSLPSQFQHSIRSFLCFICAKCKKCKDVSNEMGCRRPRPGIPGAQSPGGGAQARHTLGSWWDSSSYCTSWPQLSISSNPLP